MELIQDCFQRQPLLLTFQSRVLFTYHQIWHFKILYIFRTSMYACYEDLGEHSRCFATRRSLSAFIAQYKINLTFMGPWILSVFQYISKKMQRYTVYLYLETALHVSGGTSTHHQERIQLYLQHLVFVTPLLLSAAIVEELELVWVCCAHAHSNKFHLFHDSDR